MSRRLSSGLLLRGSFAAFIIAAAAPVWVLSSRFHDAPGDDATIGVERPELPPPVESADIGREYLAVAVAAAPFAPDRRPPVNRFRMPGRAAAAFEQRNGVVGAEAAPTAAIQLLGTMVLPGGGGLALVRGMGEEPKLIRIGESVGTLILRKVQLGTAVFVTSDGSVVELEVVGQGA